MWSEGQSLQNGKYTIIEPIGFGGFGITYLAKDNRLKRNVVIKTPNRSFEFSQEYDSFVRRFQKEGESLARVSHSNVVQVIELFQEKGTPSLVLAHIEGKTIEQYVQKNGALPESRLLEIFRKLSDALCQLHIKGVIHCDIHPRNIILKEDKEPILIDFGSSKNVTGTSTGTTTVNNYFSPYEQGKGGAPQRRWDIYALSATLFFAATGQNPQSAVDRKLYNANLEVAQLSKTKISDSLGQAIATGMAVEPNDRPRSVESWIRQFETYRRELSLSSKNPQIFSKRKTDDTYVWGSSVWNSIYGCIACYVLIGIVVGVSFFGSIRLPFDKMPSSWFVTDSLFFTLIYSLSSVLMRHVEKKAKNIMGWAIRFFPIVHFLGTAGLSFASLATFIKFSSGQGLITSISTLFLTFLLVWLFVWLGFRYGLITYHKNFYTQKPIIFSWWESTLAALSICFLLYQQNFRNITYNEASAFGAVAFLALAMAFGFTSMHYYDLYENHYTKAEKTSIVCSVCLTSFIVGILAGWPLSMHDMWQ